MLSQSYQEMLNDWKGMAGQRVSSHFHQQVLPKQVTILSDQNFHLSYECKAVVESNSFQRGWLNDDVGQSISQFTPLVFSYASSSTLYPCEWVTGQSFVYRSFEACKLVLAQLKYTNTNIQMKIYKYTNTDIKIKIKNWGGCWAFLQSKARVTQIYKYKNTDENNTNTNIHIC